MKVQEIIDFLETDIISLSKGSQGLKLFSLREGMGDESVALDDLAKENSQNPFWTLLFREIVNFLREGKHRMPLDLSAFTPFQQEVFRALGDVEPGSILTYKELATSLGRPGGAQAVGNAIAKNPVSFFLPTHRILPQKGIGICRTGAGYLRERLLEKEGHDLSKLRGNYLCPRKKCCNLPDN